MKKGTGRIRGPYPEHITYDTLVPAGASPRLGALPMQKGRGGVNPSRPKVFLRKTLETHWCALPLCGAPKPAA